MQYESKKDSRIKTFRLNSKDLEKLASIKSDLSKNFGIEFNDAMAIRWCLNTICTLNKLEEK